MVTVVTDSPDYKLPRTQLLHDLTVRHIADVVVHLIELVWLEIRDETHLEVLSKYEIK